MNLVELVGNKFLKAIYPNGIGGHILIGQISLDIADQVLLSIHVSQPPNKEVAKWGEWGKDYNVIVINILAQFISKVEIINWQDVNHSLLEIVLKENGVYSISSRGSNWNITIDFKSLTFQRCDIYKVNK